MSRILLKNIVSEGRKCDICVEDGLIAWICPPGEGPELPVDTDIEDCTGKVALPGLVNSHTHAAMTLFRGVGEDVCFADWIDRIWKEETKIDGEYVYWATKVACLEMIKTGTTTFYDQYWHVPAAEKAVEEMGLRAVLSYVNLDHYDAGTRERQMRECTEVYRASRDWPGNITFSVAVHSVYSVSEELISWAADFARKNGVKLNVHLCETEKEVLDCKARHGVSPVKFLDRLGFLGPDVIAAHTLWVDDDDIRILAERGVSCVHNINSNLKLASGYRFRYREMKDAGINLCLGTDGCASSNNLDLQEAMKTAALVQKAWRNDPRAMPLDELLAMATSNASSALGLDCGKIAAGCLADIIIIDTDSTFFLSNAPFLANFVYSAHSDCVESVICNGRFVMRHRKVEGEKEILARARELLGRIA
ncbi:MAG: amidohydrolase [Bacteroidetes bacterium]|uniref:Amidohydrolase n=1 Tax=Candidatus Cryptobacteroides merdigallinarum TaxID=2840770 RepID=A0A9D9EHE1_9BACT|nr:amidohydrolase [Candidatus Cryptobacteroides merdigallinarum]